jgi:hypothetical protein
LEIGASEISWACGLQSRIAEDNVEQHLQIKCLKKIADENVEQYLQMKVSKYLQMKM